MIFQSLLTFLSDSLCVISKNIYFYAWKINGKMQKFHFLFLFNRIFDKFASNCKRWKIISWFTFTLQTTRWVNKIFIILDLIVNKKNLWKFVKNLENLVKKMKRNCLDYDYEIIKQSLMSSNAMNDENLYQKN